MPYRLIRPTPTPEQIRQNPRLLDNAAIRRQRLITSIKILIGWAAFGALIWLVLHWFGFGLLTKVGWGFAWVGLSVVLWLGSARIALWMNKCAPADANNIKHQRGIRASTRAFANTGYSPPTYASPDRRGNAFATGPFPAWAVVAFTEGILDDDDPETAITDDELWAVFCHEATHVLDWHVAINSLAGALSMVFSLLVDVVVRGLLGSLNFFGKALGMKPLSLDGKQHGFLGGILINVILYAVFYVTSNLTRIIQFFIVRAAESQADAGAAAMTGKPCLLVSALEKLVKKSQKNRPVGRDLMVWLSTRLISIIDPIYDSIQPDSQPQGFWEWLKALWKQTQLSHPPVPVRRADLEDMNGGPCPALPSA